MLRKEHPAATDRAAAGCFIFIILTFHLLFFIEGPAGRSSDETPHLL
jgi:hypothetical protein